MPLPLPLPLPLLLTRTRSVTTTMLNATAVVDERDAAHRMVLHARRPTKGVSFTSGRRTQAHKHTNACNTSEQRVCGRCVCVVCVCVCVVRVCESMWYVCA